MYSFFFKRPSPESNSDYKSPSPGWSSRTKGPRATDLFAGDDGEKKTKRIYAPSSSTFSRNGLGEIREIAREGLSIAVDPGLAPLRPSKRNTNIIEEKLITKESRRTQPGKTQDENIPTHTLPFPALHVKSPSGTFGHPTIREQTMAKMKSIPQYQPPSRASSAQSDIASSAFYSFANSSASTINQEYIGSTPSSSNTFGTRTPARSFSSNRRVRVEEIFFSHLETPPPLPPLNHPAFLETVVEREFDLGIPAEKGAEDEKEPRYTRSLPAIRRASKDALTETGGTRPRRRGSTKSSIVSKLDGRSRVEEALRKTHRRSLSRNSEKSSLSRRSSAEFSAKQASLLGLDGGTDGSHESWEIQVSKELLRLSLGQGVVAGGGGGHPSARGPSNVGSIKRSHGESGGVRGLGSPFSFQVPSSPNQDPTHHRTAAIGKTGHPLGTLPSTDSAISISSMAESYGLSNNAKGILNPTPGKFRPKPNNGHAPRPGRSNSTPNRTRTPSPPPPMIDTISSVTSAGQGTSSLLAPPVLSLTAPTPEASPISPKRAHHKSSPAMPPSALRTPPPPSGVQKAHSSGSTKRKADEAEVDGGTPPREREHRTTFAPEPRTHRASATSGSSHAPSSFHRSKRVRTSLNSGDSHVPARSALPIVSGDSPNAKSTGSWSSRNSKASTSHVGREPRSSRPPSTRASTKDVHASHAPRRSTSRRSLSQASIPMSAFMSPHAPSVSRSSTYHMRDPRKPARIQDTPWTLSFPDEVEDANGNVTKWSFDGWLDRGGSPLHAWLFFIGFVVFPLWFLAGFAVPIPRTRRLESGDAEKGVVLDDPQVEHDSKSWRKRCRIMAGVSVVTYVPFIVLVAIYA